MRQALLWLGAYTTSVTGDVMFYLALSWAVIDSAGPAAVGAVVAAAAVPRAVLMLVGGVLADRFAPRRLILVADAARCLAVVIGAGWFHLAGTVWPLVTMSVVFGLVDAVFMPAVGALPPRLTTVANLARLQAWRSLAVRLANAVGPSAAAVVLTAFGSAGAFAVIGLLFVASIPMVAVLRPAAVPSTGGPRRAVRRDLGDGLRHIVSDRRLSRWVLGVGLAELVFSGPLAVGLVLFVDENDWGPTVLGLSLTAFSVGGAVTGLALAAARAPRRPTMVATVAAAGAATCLVALPFSPGPGAAVAATAVLGAVGGVAGVVGTAQLQVMTDPRYLGRVTAVTTLCTVGLAPVLLPVAGLVTAAWGAGVFFVGCAVVCLAAAIVVGTSSSGARSGTEPVMVSDAAG